MENDSEITRYSLNSPGGRLLLPFLTVATITIGGQFLTPNGNQQQDLDFLSERGEIIENTKIYSPPPDSLYTLDTVLQD
ncbi:hypothetical protein K8R33_04625 [archaeon]|nr:hypothetical protein [archaeon]